MTSSAFPKSLLLCLILSRNVCLSIHVEVNIFRRRKIQFSLYFPAILSYNQLTIANVIANIKVTTTAVRMRSFMHVKMCNNKEKSISSGWFVEIVLWDGCQSLAYAKLSSYSSIIKSVLHSAIENE